MRVAMTTGAIAGVLALAAGSALGDTFSDLASFQGATQNLNLCNFDVDSFGVEFHLFNQIGERYSPLGVSFPPGNYTAGIRGAVSEPNGWFNDTSPDGTSRVFDCNFTAANVTAVGVWQGELAGGGGTQLVAYNAAGAVIGSASGDNIASTVDFFGLTTTSPIARITVTFSPPFQGYGLDDLYFGESLGGGDCAADFNGDNQADFFDYLDFAAAFDAEDPSADFNGDNQVDFFDYLDFVQAFDEGC